MSEDSSALDLWLIAGLGNPGAKYEDTRHNFGFLVLDELFSRSNSVTGTSSFGAWKEQKGAQVCKVQLCGKSLILVKPYTFMNLSGEPLRAIMDFYKVSKERLLIVHDEVDLPFEVVRLKSGGGDGGHNGLKSVFNQCGGRDFLRLRMGVGRPENPNFDTSDWVLSSFSQEEKSLLPEIIGFSVDAIEQLLEEGLTATQKRVNTNRS
ncbi:MAG: aminoacyl-tRNA hydrolase [Bdellovibrionota bacterium]